MYQLPVGNIEKIRKARKAVKNILSEIGLEDCQNLQKVCFIGSLGGLDLTVDMSNRDKNLCPPPHSRVVWVSWGEIESQPPALSTLIHIQASQEACCFSINGCHANGVCRVACIVRGSPEETLIPNL